MHVAAIGHTFRPIRFVSSPAVGFSRSDTIGSSAGTGAAIGVGPSADHKPQPPFSLSQTAQLMQLSSSFLHFVAGELTLALLRQFRSESSAHVGHRLNILM